MTECSSFTTNIVNEATRLVGNSQAPSDFGVVDEIADHECCRINAIIVYNFSEKPN